MKYSFQAELCHTNFKQHAGKISFKRNQKQWNPNRPKMRCNFN